MLTFGSVSRAAGLWMALRPYPEYSRAYSYPWSPFHLRRARSGPSLHTARALDGPPDSEIR